VEKTHDLKVNDPGYGVRPGDFFREIILRGKGGEGIKREDVEPTQRLSKTETNTYKQFFTSREGLRMVNRISKHRTLAVLTALTALLFVARQGETVKFGYEIWKDIANEQGGININGEYYKIEIKYYDDKSDTSTALKLTEKLITEDEIDFLLAPFGSGPTFAVSTVTEKYKRPIIAGQSSSFSIFNRGYDYVFGIMCDTRYYQKPAFELAASKGVKTVAIAYENMIWGIDTAKASIDHATNNDMSVVFYDKFDSNAMDLSSILLKINDVKPDFLAVNSYLKQGALLARQMKDLKVNIPLVSFGYGPQEDVWRENTADAGMYMISDTQFDATNTTLTGRIIASPAEFAKRFRDKYGYTPGHGESNAAGCGLAYQLAMEKAGSLDVEKVVEALHNLDEQTFLGRMQFEFNGARMHQPQYAIQIQTKDVSQKPVIVYPFESAKADVIFPAPKWDERE
jgi:branched-chain amino acid transport system substrate-binding protein